MAKAVEVADVMDHLEAFQDIADSHDGNRGAGTSGYDASGAYVEDTLRAAGYDTQRQWFDFTYFEVVSSSLTVGGSPIDENVMSYSPSTPVGGVTGPLAAPAVATGCAAGDWAGFPAGSVALISRGACAFGVKAANAKTAGAVAAVVYNNEEGELHGTLGGPGDYAPATGITQADGKALLARLGETTTFEAQTVLEERSTFNVLAETDKGRDDNVVMMGAHLDSVNDGPGINDNGTGSAALLETAVQLAKANKLNNKLRFAWWGAEEHGLLGSEHYVADLKENDPAALEDIATYLNFDMVGSPNHIIGVYDADQSTYEADVDVPEGSAETEDVLTDWFDSQDQAWVDTPFSGRSDYAAFIDAGIPSSGLFTGADDVKTEEQEDLFGGTAGIILDPNYHTPEDDISNLNVDALDVMSDAIAASAILLAQDTSDINNKRSRGKSGKPGPDVVVMEHVAHHLR
ncbi:M20/M25/M40 family metallo-hydrolase [Nocardioides seonyuensis]|uniref:M20/M25/M40 family metallo-hydrolase n=2 Tax=Nocardioides seonyuensis TaxID=2518371 RepID=A0A4P7ILN3_9ACTN|nr:M20/M25/M40 family metallo-hydrolase [Nocardioides seonyuensis]